ncbi:unnamed protein product [Oikopleura dioica]|uniref:Uncharacterized protein n=1 Tax=Oikopleura dioica TaxID=34765 RepID=E4XXA1_OIKDI|nr:unnamed protein product [Oikopleura dioica]CBY37454.1 unnamed protein product [Oikopleura dioica]
MIIESDEINELIEKCNGKAKIEDSHLPRKRSFWSQEQGSKFRPKVDCKSEIKKKIAKRKLSEHQIRFCEA